MSERAETNRERIEAIQKLLPPAPGVTSRQGYASLDHFAALLGTNRSHMIQWKKGVEPSPRHRERLAELSGGLYAPEDFAIRGAAGPGAAADEDVAILAASLEALEATVEKLERTVEYERRQRRHIQQRLDALEHLPVRAVAGSGPRGRAS